MSGRPGPAGRRTARISPAQLGPALGRAAARITDRDRWLLRLLHEHTVVTTSHLYRMRLAPSLRAVQGRLAALHQLGVLDRFQPRLDVGSAPIHHLLGPLGVQILAAELGVEPSALGWRRDRLLAVAHRLSLRHDMAVVDLVCDLVADPGLRIEQWWSPARCRRLVGHHVRPDTYLALTLTSPDPGLDTGPGPGPSPGPGRGRRWEMWIEYDTGTTSLPVLAAKLRHYHALAAATGVVVPVGIWIARPGREPSARRALADAHRTLRDPALVPVLTATGQPTSAPAGESGAGGSGAGERVALRRPGGAQDRIWLPLAHPGGPPRRYRLAELARHDPRPSFAESIRPNDDPGPYSSGSTPPDTWPPDTGTPDTWTPGPGTPDTDPDGYDTGIDYGHGYSGYGGSSGYGGYSAAGSGGYGSGPAGRGRVDLPPPSPYPPHLHRTGHQPQPRGAP